MSKEYSQNKENNSIRLKKVELLHLLVSAIEEFPSFNGQLSLSLNSGCVSSFMRNTSGDTESEMDNEIQDPFARIERKEVIRRLNAGLVEIGAWGKLTVTFALGVVVNISWSCTYDLLPKAKEIIRKKGI